LRHIIDVFLKGNIEYYFKHPSKKRAKVKYLMLFKRCFKKGTKSYRWILARTVTCKVITTKM
jgi:hypothetical protein